MKPYTLQKQVEFILSKGEWMTVGEVASALGYKANTSIRVILDTLAFCGAIQSEWSLHNNKYAAFYRATPKGRG